MKKTIIIFSGIFIMTLFANTSGAQKNLYYTRINSITKIIGSLGKPLGEIITIEGVIIDGSYSRSKSDAGKLFLKVSSINNNKLANPVTIEFQAFQWINIKKPEENHKFKYIGYETGEMRGIPHRAFNYMTRAATTGYHFFVYFQICKEIK